MMLVGVRGWQEDAHQGMASVACSFVPIQPCHYQFRRWSPGLRLLLFWAEATTNVIVTTTINLLVSLYGIAVPVPTGRTRIRRPST